MLNRKIPKLRLYSKSKGEYSNDRNRIAFSINNSGLTSIILSGIPALSIFVLLSGFWFGLIGVGSSFSANSVQAAGENTTNPTASLIVNDGNIKDTITTMGGELAYAAHGVNVSAKNVKTYSLIISGTTNLTTTSSNTVVTGANGATPSEMNNQWGYAWIDPEANPYSANYNSLNPDGTNLDGLSIDSNHNLVGNKKLVFGVKFGKEAVSGTYSTKVSLSLVTTPRVISTYKVSFNCNGGTDCPAGLAATESDDESYRYIIPTTEPTRAGYKFLGYSKTNGATADSNYAPGKEVILTTASPTLTLYAIWQSTATWNSITTMQQMTTDVCASASIGSSKTLTDTRDYKTYSVAKLSDGNCWMTSNLTLDLSVAGIAKAADSDNLATSFPSSALTNYTNSWASSNTAPAFSRGPTKIYGTGGAYQTNYGYYYNWCAATAGSCMDDDNAVSSGDAASSICPKGWRLPKSGSSNNNFAALGSATAVSGGVSLGGASWPYVGAFNTAGLIDAGRVGYYWSRTASSASAAYHLSIGSGTTVNASRSYNKSDGYAVRCIAK